MQASTPNIGPLAKLVEHYVPPVSASWLAPSLPLPASIANAPTRRLIPTHIKHYRTSMPTDAKELRRQKLERMKTARERKRKKERWEEVDGLRAESRQARRRLAAATEVPRDG